MIDAFLGIYLGITWRGSNFLDASCMWFGKFFANKRALSYASEGPPTHVLRFENANFRISIWVGLL